MATWPSSGITETKVIPEKSTTMQQLVGSRHPLLADSRGNIKWPSVMLYLRASFIHSISLSFYNHLPLTGWEYLRFASTPRF